jgi:hypothetical protein
MKIAISPEELARREAEDEIFYQRCREIFGTFFGKNLLITNN